PVDADKGKKLIVKVTPRTDPVITEPAVGDEVLSDVATVSTSPASLVNSSLTVTTVQAAYTITAGQQTDTDQNTKATLTLMLKDAATTPNAVKGQTVSFSITPADAGVAVSNVVDNQDGTYTAVLTATKAQQYAITA
ncbi:invasin domain 3-containing protein, partial [Kluyvera ascorbata]